MNHSLKNFAFGASEAEKQAAITLRQIRAEIKQKEKEIEIQNQIEKDILSAYDSGDFEKIFDIARSYRS